MVNQGTNRKGICEFLLVINYSNVGHILPRFEDIAGFLLPISTPPLFHPNFGVFPLDSIADVEAPRRGDNKLITRVNNLELIQLIRPRHINVTDGRATYDSNTALCTTCIAR